MDEGAASEAVRRRWASLRIIRGGEGRDGLARRDRTWPSTFGSVGRFGVVDVMANEPSVSRPDGSGNGSEASGDDVSSEG